MTNLSQVDLVQHHQTGAAVVVNQTPEIFDGVGQRMLGNDERSRLSVALQGTEDTAQTRTSEPPIGSVA